MTTSTLGRVVACVESFAAGLCLTLVATAFLSAAEAQISTPTEPIVAFSTAA
jgi:hypothetical protein